MLKRLTALRITGRSFSIRASCRQKATDVIDDLGVPLHATWSVGKLLSTYPAPELSNDTLARLHRLAALDPPETGTSAAESLRLEIQELLRLVEAVKLVNTSPLGGRDDSDIPDSRIWADGRGIDLDAPHANHLDEAHGQVLLQHAHKHIEGQYVVETAPRSRGAKAS